MSPDIFFVADDFGCNAAVNTAIVSGHVNGVLTGASLMLGQPGTAAAITLARHHPALHIGWHLHLCHSQPLTVPVWPWGDSPARAGLTIGLWPSARALLRREVAAQWAEFRRTGLPCAFVNVHHHLHAHPAVYAELLKVLPRNFTGWIRLGAPRFFTPKLSQWLLASSDRLVWRARRRKCPFASSDTLWGVDRLYRMQVNEINQTLAQLPAGRHEFMFHPRATANDNDLACLIELRRSPIYAREC